MSHELVTTERWRFERIVDELDELARDVICHAPAPWNEVLTRPLDSDTHRDIRQREHEIAEDVLAFAETHHDLHERIACPLCGDRTQSGLAFKVPLGLERHLTGNRCIVLKTWAQYWHRYANQQQGREVWDAHADRDDVG